MASRNTTYSISSFGHKVGDIYIEPGTWKKYRVKRLYFDYHDDGSGICVSAVYPEWEFIGYEMDIKVKLRIMLRWVRWALPYYRRWFIPQLIHNWHWPPRKIYNWIKGVDFAGDPINRWATFRRKSGRIQWQR